MTHDLLVGARVVASLIAMLGLFMLGREQAATVSRGRPARPARIVGYVGIVLLGLALGVVAILAAG